MLNQEFAEPFDHAWDPDWPPDPEEQMHEHVVECSECHQPFVFRSASKFQHGPSQPIDFVCRGCFGAWIQAWEQKNDWSMTITGRSKQGTT